MMTMPYSSAANEIERLRLKRRLLAAKDDSVPLTLTGFRHLQHKLATEAAASRERNNQLLRLVQNVSKFSYGTAADVQLCALRGAYISLVHKSFPQWYRSTAAHIQQASQQQQQASAAPHNQEQPCNQSMYGAVSCKPCGVTSALNGQWPSAASTCGQEPPAHTLGRCTVATSATSISAPVQPPCHATAVTRNKCEAASAAGRLPQQAELAAVPPAVLEQLANSMSEQLLLLQQLVQQQTQQQQQQQYQSVNQVVRQHTLDQQHQQLVQHQSCDPHHRSSSTEAQVGCTTKPAVTSFLGAPGAAADIVCGHTVAAHTSMGGCLANQPALPVPSGQITISNGCASTHSLAVLDPASKHHTSPPPQQQGPKRVCLQNEHSQNLQQLDVSAHRVVQRAPAAAQQQGPTRWHRITELEKQQGARQQQQEDNKQVPQHLSETWQEREPAVQQHQRHHAPVRQALHSQQHCEQQQQQQATLPPSMPEQVAVPGALVTPACEHAESAGSRGASSSAELSAMHGARQPQHQQSPAQFMVPIYQQQEEQGKREQHQEQYNQQPIGVIDGPATAMVVQQHPTSGHMQAHIHQEVLKRGAQVEQQPQHAASADKAHSSCCRVPGVTPTAAQEWMSLVDSVLVQQDSTSSVGSDPAPELPPPLAPDDVLSPDPSSLKGVTPCEDSVRQNTEVTSQPAAEGTQAASTTAASATLRQLEPDQAASCQPGQDPVRTTTIAMLSEAAAAAATVLAPVATAVTASATSKGPKPPPPAPPLLLAALDMCRKPQQSLVAAAAAAEAAAAVPASGRHLGSAVAAAVAQLQHVSNTRASSAGPTTASASCPSHGSAEGPGQKLGISSLAVALGNTSPAATTAASRSDSALISAGAVISRPQGSTAQQQNLGPLGFQRIPSRTSSQQAGGGLLLSPATRLSLGAVGNDPGCCSGRPSLSSDSEVFSPFGPPARRSSLGARRSSVGAAAVSDNVRLQAPLKVPNAAVPGRRINADSSSEGWQLSTQGVQMEAPHAQEQQQQQQQSGGGFSPLSASIHRLGSGSVNIPLLPLGRLLRSHQQQQQHADSSSAAAGVAQTPTDEPPLLPRCQRQQQSQQQQQAELQVGGQNQGQPSLTQAPSHKQTQATASPYKAKPLNATSLNRGHSRSPGAGVTSDPGRLVSKVLNSGLTDFAGSDSDDEHDEASDANVQQVFPASSGGLKALGSTGQPMVVLQPAAAAGGVSRPGGPFKQQQVFLAQNLVESRGFRSSGEDEFDF